jgi:hypothetical protein
MDSVGSFLFFPCRTSDVLLTLLIVNFECLDDTVRARKALNGRGVLVSDARPIRIGFAKAVKNGQEGSSVLDDSPSVAIQGVGDLSVNATIDALRSVKGTSTIAADQQVLCRSNLLLSVIGPGMHNIVYASDGLSEPVGSAFCDRTINNHAGTCQGKHRRGDGCPGLQALCGQSSSTFCNHILTL